MLGKIAQGFNGFFGGIFGGKKQSPSRQKKSRSSILPTSRNAAQKMAVAPSDIKNLLPFSPDEFNELNKTIKTAFEKRAIGLINEVKTGVLKLTDLNKMGEPVKEALQNAGINTENILKVNEIFSESGKIGFGKIMKLANTLQDIEKTLSFYEKVLNPQTANMQAA